MQMRTAILAALSVLLLASSTISPIMSPALARGGHGRGMHMRGAGGGFASDRRHGNDAEVKAAAEENDRLLNNKIKSICRGC
jgi:hypothetical protein